MQAFTKRRLKRAAWAGVSSGTAYSATPGARVPKSLVTLPIASALNPATLRWLANASCSNEWAFTTSACVLETRRGFFRRASEMK
jgi:hypothetical protein